MLSMEEKKSFINKIRELNDDEKVVKDWVWEENARIRYNNDIAAAEEQGLEQGIESNKREIIVSMLKEQASYEFIEKVTGKTLEEIKEIEKDIKIS